MLLQYILLYKSNNWLKKVNYSAQMIMPNRTAPNPAIPGLDVKKPVRRPFFAAENCRTVPTFGPDRRLKLPERTSLG